MIYYIYKITSPTGRIYIGQTKCTKKRFYSYSKNQCKSQKRLYRSFNKYGFENHIIEIIEECDSLMSNERERYWQEYYDVIGENGLNCLLTSTSDLPLIFKKDILERINKSKYGNKNMLGKKHSEQTKKKLSLIFKGCKHTEETKQKISKAQLGRKLSEETIKKIILANTGRIASEETKKKISEALTGRKIPQHVLDKRKISCRGDKNKLSKIILNLDSGIFHGCSREAAEAYNINQSTLKGYLTGNRKNKTNLVYA
jgi:group I intron endonuclease